MPLPRSRRSDSSLSFEFEALESRRVFDGDAMPGEPLGVSLSNNDEFLIAARDTLGGLRTFEATVYPNNGWFTLAADNAEQGGRPASPVATFTGFDGTSRIATTTTEDGVLLYTPSANGLAWYAIDLTTSDDGVITSNVVSAVTSGGDYIAGTNADGDVIVYENTGGDWYQHNLSDEFFGGQGPGWTGRLIAYSTSWDSINIAGLNAEGEIVTVWTAPGLNGWAMNNLSETAGAPTFVGGLSEYTTPWSGVNVTAIDEQGDLNVVWWVPSFGADWVVTDFNEQFGGPKLDADSITAYVTPWNGLNVAGLDASGMLWSYWWVPDFASDPANDYWRVEDLSDDFDSSSVQPRGPLTADVSSDGVITIYGVEEDADVVQIYWTSAAGWRSQNISDEAVSP